MPVNKKGEDKMENAKVSNKKLMSLAILFVSALEMGGMGLQPALADIAAAFPDIPTVWMQEMSNWPGFAMLLGCALSTLLATKVSKKALCQIGVGFVVAYAILGFTLHSSFIQLMMWQTILGLGFGFLMPTSNGIIAENYAEDERGQAHGHSGSFHQWRRHVPDPYRRRSCCQSLELHLPCFPLRTDPSGARMHLFPR